MKDVLAYNKMLKIDFTNNPLNVYYESNGDKITLIYSDGVEINLDKYEMNKLIEIKREVLM